MDEGNEVKPRVSDGWADVLELSLLISASFSQDMDIRGTRGFELARRQRKWGRGGACFLRLVVGEALGDVRLVKGVRSRWDCRRMPGEDRSNNDGRLNHIKIGEDSTRFEISAHSKRAFPICGVWAESPQGKVGVLHSEFWRGHRACRGCQYSHSVCFSLPRHPLQLDGWVLASRT